MIRQLTTLFAGLSALLVLAACGGTTPTSEGGGRTATAGPEAGNGEATAVPYTDARFHYRIDAPGTMSANPDGTAGVVGPSERLQVAVVQGGQAADPSGLAKADSASLGQTLTAYQLKSGPGPITLNGRQATKFVYAYTAGTNTVTGKPLTLVGVRYYIPKDASTLAVVTYGVSTSQYDPQGADDIALTFKWL